MTRQNITFKAKRHPGKRATKPMLNVDRPTIRQELVGQVNHHLFFADIALHALRADALVPLDSELRLFAAEAKTAVAAALKESAKQARRLKREARKAK